MTLALTPRKSWRPVVVFGESDLEVTLSPFNYFIDHLPERDIFQLDKGANITKPGLFQTIPEVLAQGTSQIKFSMVCSELARYIVILSVISND